jgi:hypothetical protein
LNKVQFDSIAFQERNGTCGMKPERSGRNLAEKSGTNQDLKWDEICFVLWIDMKCFGNSEQNGTKLIWTPRLWRHAYENRLYIKLSINI